MKKLFTKYSTHQILLYLAGCLAFSLGAKFFIDSKLGVDPLDVLVLGIVAHTGLTIGVVAGLIAIGFLALWSYWNRRRPPITPFITMFLVGSLIDLWNYVELEKITTALTPYPLLFTGLLTVAYGSSLIIMSGIGIRVMDLVAITLVRRWGWSFFSAKMAFELGFVIAGALLGGPVGVGTLAFLLVVGACIVAFMRANERMLNIPNYGLARA